MLDADLVNPASLSFSRYDCLQVLCESDLELAQLAMPILNDVGHRLRILSPYTLTTFPGRGSGHPIRIAHIDAFYYSILVMKDGIRIRILQITQFSQRLSGPVGTLTYSVTSLQRSVGA